MFLNLVQNVEEEGVEDMTKRQETFEDNIILESDLALYYSKDGDAFQLTLDNFPFDFLTLSEVSSEYGKDIDFEGRKSLQIIINERLGRLNDLQREIAELRYIENKSIREIRKVVNKSLSTIHYHITKINGIIRSI